MFNIRSFGQLTIVLNEYVLKNTIKANKSKYTKHKANTFLSTKVEELVVVRDAIGNS